MGYFSNQMIGDQEDFGRALPDLAQRPSWELADELTPEQVRRVAEYRASTPLRASDFLRERAALPSNAPTRVLSIMVDGTLIADDVEDFAHYVALVLGYRRDPDCRCTNVYAGARVVQIWHWSR